MRCLRLHFYGKPWALLVLLFFSICPQVSRSAEPWEGALRGMPLGTSSVTLYTYFSQASSSLFDWAMTSAEARIAFSDKLEFRGGMELSASGTKFLRFGVRYDW